MKELVRVLYTVQKFNKSLALKISTSLFSYACKLFRTRTPDWKNDDINMCMFRRKWQHQPKLQQPLRLLPQLSLHQVKKSIQSKCQSKSSTSKLSTSKSKWTWKASISCTTWICLLKRRGLYPVVWCFGAAIIVEGYWPEELCSMNIDEAVVVDTCFL